MYNLEFPEWVLNIRSPSTPNMSLSIPIPSFLDLHSLLFPRSDLLLITLLICTLIIPYLFYTLFFHPLARIPGPWLSAITPIHHHVFTFLKGQEHETDIQLHQRYGPFVRIAPNTVMCEDPEVLKTVYAARGVVKGEYYSEVDWKGKGQGDGSVKSVFHEREPEGHRAARRRVAHPFSNSSIQSMRPVIESRIDTWISQLSKFADSGDVLDFSDWAQFLAYDVITELCFGSPFGFIEQGKDVGGLIGQFHKAMPYTSILMRCTWLLKLLNWSGLGSILMPKPGDGSGLGRVLKFRNDKLDERLAHPSNKPDILTYLLTSNSKASSPLPPHLWRAQLESDLILFMIAGTDTTSSTFRSILLALHQHPECTQKIFSSSSASPGKVDVRYLQALIRETIRLYHAPASFFPRIIPVGGVTLPDGTKFPAGTEVTVQPWALHRSKKGAFGEDAEEFRPERWLVDDEEKEGETEKERVRRLEKDTFMWGYGSRTCLGRSIAELELLAGMTKFIETFEWEFVDPTKPFQSVSNYNIIVHNGIHIRLRRRHSEVRQN